MSIRTKFFALAGILLLLFGCVIGVLSLLQAATARRLEIILARHQPMRRVLADLDVDADKYELLVKLLAEAGELDPLRTELRDTFAEGLAAYRRQDWCAASAQFEACRRLVPDDGPSAVFLERIARLREEPPSAGWDGVWHLKTK